MRLSASPALTSAPAVGPARLRARAPAPDLETSARWPLLLLLLSALSWLLLGTLLSILASIKFHSPGFLADASWLTYGRVRPAAMNALVYGFASQAGMGVALWMLSRLGGTRLGHQALLFLGGGLWNLGLLLGLLGLLGGDTTGFEWLEMPGYASPLLFVAFLLMALCALVNFHDRPERGLYVSSWYLLAALFGFAWIYPAANYLLVFDPVRGTMQPVIAAWFSNGLFGLWLTSIGLAAVFYFIPKLAGRPLANYWLAVFGFWTLVAFGNWSGPAALIGSPAPRWIASVGIAASLLMLVPLVAVALNWQQTMQGAWARVRRDLVLRFVIAGAACYLLAGFASVLLGIRGVAAVTQFTLVPVARTQLVVHGFMGLVLSSCIYFMLPRLTGVPWPSPRLIRVHFWLSVAGVGLIILALTVGGVVQGWRMRNPNVDFVSVARSMIPFVGNATFGLLILLGGQGALCWNLWLLLKRFCERACPLQDWLSGWGMARPERKG